MNGQLKKIIAIGIGSVIATIVAIVLCNTPSRSITIQGLPFGSSSFATLAGDSIYHTDGDAFMKTNVATGKTDILMNGLRLPVIKKLFWVSDTQALVTFTGSALYTAADNGNIDTFGLDADISDYVWVILFKERSITLLSRSKIIGPAYKKDSHVYYVTAEGTGNTTLNDYIPASKSIGKTKSLPSGIRDVAGIFNCQNTLCVLAQTAGASGDQSILFKIEDGVSLEKTYQGRANFMNDTIIVSNPQNISTEPIEDYTDAGPYDITIYDIDGKELLKTTQSLQNYIKNQVGDLGVTITDGQKGSIIAYQTKSLIDLPLRVTSEDILTNDVAVTEIQSGDTTSLLHGSNGLYYIGYVNKVSQTLLGKPVSKDSVVRQCAQIITYSQSDNSYIIEVVNDEAVNKTIQQISDCIHKNPNDISNVTYRFSLSSPVSGRIISN